MPLGIVPCGSGNGMARSLNVHHIGTATHAIIKGHCRRTDMMACTQSGRDTLYAHLVVMWGLVSDIDIESEKYRWAGAARFTMSGIARILSLRKYVAHDCASGLSSTTWSLIIRSSRALWAGVDRYPGRLCFLPWHAGEDSQPPDCSGNAPTLKYPLPDKPEEHGWVVRADSVDAVPAGLLCRSVVPGRCSHGPDAAAGQVVESKFVLVIAQNLPYIANDAYFAPYAYVAFQISPPSWCPVLSTTPRLGVATN